MIVLTYPALTLNSEKVYKRTRGNLPIFEAGETHVTTTGVYDNTPTMAISCLFW